MLTKMSFLFILTAAPFVTYVLSADILATSVRDSSLGIWAPNITVRLFRAEGDTSDISNLEWTLIKTNVTDAFGKIPVLASGTEFPVGYYKIVFRTRPYWRAKNLETFYPSAEVQFEKVETDVNKTLLVPLMMEAYGYNSYRGSLAQLP